MAYQNQKVKTRQIKAPNTQTENLGIVSEVPMGAWNATVQYKKLNTIRYSGATYIALKQNVGVEPTVTLGWQEVWQVIAYDGRGISSTEITYQAGISNSTVPSGEWSTNVVAIPQGQYLWTRTVYNYTDGTQTIAYSVSLQGLNFTQQDRDDIDKIINAIPSSASETNPLATQDFVNSSINNMAAFYITYNASGDAFPTRADLLNATTFYNGGEVRVPTQNDYAYVLSDESQPKDSLGNYPTTRYSYQGGTYPNGQWGFQYIVNNTSLTQAQVNAINSGITKELVEQFSASTGDNVVTLSGPPQTITGQKTFTQPINAVGININNDALLTGTTSTVAGLEFHRDYNYINFRRSDSENEFDDKLFEDAAGLHYTTLKQGNGFMFDGPIKGETRQFAPNMDSQTAPTSVQYLLHEFKDKNLKRVGLVGVRQHANTNWHTTFLQSNTLDADGNEIAFTELGISSVRNDDGSIVVRAYCPPPPAGHENNDTIATTAWVKNLLKTNPVQLANGWDLYAAEPSGGTSALYIRYNGKNIMYIRSDGIVNLP